MGANGKPREAALLLRASVRKLGTGVKFCDMAVLTCAVGREEETKVRARHSRTHLE